VSAVGDFTELARSGGRGALVTVLSGHSVASLEELADLLEGGAP